MLFPVYVYDEGVELPSDGTYYVVAGNGQFLHKDTGLVKCFVPVDNIASLEDLDTESWVETNLPRLDAKNVQKIKEFFRQVVAEYASESSTTLYYNKDTEEYKVFVPEQQVSHGGVNYKMTLTDEEEAEFNGFLRVGTIHSHCDFGAFHSGTDVHDEEDFDGVHVTFGHNNRDEFSISASIVVNGRRTKVDPCEVLEGIDHQEGEYFTLTESADHDVSQWMTKVSPMGGSRWGLRPMSWTPKYRGPTSYTVNAGDKVKWAQPASPALQDRFGKGPFEVNETLSDFIVVQTDKGLCCLEKRRFTKHEENQKN